MVVVGGGGSGALGFIKCTHQGINCTILMYLRKLLATQELKVFTILIS
jgi:succinate dehydrogenase/fumarate reductase flavoprotein subunit